MSHVVIRTVRPYSSEEEYLQAEGWTVTRKGVVLLDQESHPSGTVVRFEVKLATGARLLRAEGIVVAFRPANDGYPSQLELRFKRFDAATKALIESAEALAALTEDDFEEIEDVEALSDVEASAPMQSAPELSLDSDAAPDSAPGVQAPINTEVLDTQPLNTQPLNTQPLGTLEHALSAQQPDSDLDPTHAHATPALGFADGAPSEPNATLDDAVAELAESARRSSLPPARGSSPASADLNDSALKLDALISQALSEPPPAGAEITLTPLPASDPLPTIIDHGEPLADAEPLADSELPDSELPDSELSDSDLAGGEQADASDGAGEDKADPANPASQHQEPAQTLSTRRSSRPSAPSGPDASSGVHAKLPDGELRPIATPARRNELLAKLRQRALDKAQSGSGTSSGT